MSTQLKCDHCKAVKAEGLITRTIQVDSCSMLVTKCIAEFTTDLCDACQGKLVTAMQNFLRVKPTVPDGDK